MFVYSVQSEYWRLDEGVEKHESYGTYGHSLPYSTVNHCMPLCHAVTATFSRAWTRRSRGEVMMMMFIAICIS